jgi:hypothetical protein
MISKTSSLQSPTDSICKAAENFRFTISEFIEIWHYVYARGSAVRKDIQACILYAARRLAHEEVHAA